VTAVFRTAVAAVPGWFTTDDPPTLLGSRCVACGTYAFPKASIACGNPRCESTDFTEVPLSRRGRIWSYTDAQYQPPPPFIPASEPFTAFALAAVELAAEQLVVLGQLIAGVTVEELAVGQEVELVVEPLYSDEDHDYLVWKWRPV
jgi:uncharacterized OB-fold protein